MVLKGILFACVILACRACDASIIDCPWPGYGHHMRFGGLCNRRFGYLYDDAFERALFGKPVDQTLPPPSSAIPEKEYGPESRQSNTNYVISDEELSWYEARDACRSKRMVLASPDTTTKQNDLLKYVREHNLVPKDEYSGYWLGSGRLSDDEPWTWESDGQEVGQFGWLPGEPSSNKGENCMELKHSMRLGWNNFFCFEIKRFICETVPHTSESGKNTVVDTKDAIHEEMLKESPADKESQSISDLSSDPTTTTEREALPTVRELFPDSIILRNLGIGDHISKHLEEVDYNPDDTSFIDTKHEDSIAMDEGRQAISDLSYNPTTTTKRETLPILQELHPDSRNLGIVDHIPDDTSIIDKMHKDSIAMDEERQTISDLSINPTTTTERETLPIVRELNPDSIISKHLEEVDYSSDDTSFINTMHEDSRKHSLAMEDESRSISDPDLSNYDTGLIGDIYEESRQHFHGMDVESLPNFKYLSGHSTEQEYRLFGPM